MFKIEIYVRTLWTWRDSYKVVYEITLLSWLEPIVCLYVTESQWWLPLNTRLHVDSKLAVMKFLLQQFLRYYGSVKQPLYNTYKGWWLKEHVCRLDDKVVFRHDCIGYTENRPFKVIFLYDHNTYFHCNVNFKISWKVFELIIFLFVQTLHF